MRIGDRKRARLAGVSQVGRAVAMVSVLLAGGGIVTLAGVSAAAAGGTGVTGNTGSGCTTVKSWAIPVEEPSGLPLTSVLGSEGASDPNLWSTGPGWYNIPPGGTYEGVMETDLITGRNDTDSGPVQHVGPIAGLPGSFNTAQWGEWTAPDGTVIEPSKADPYPIARQPDLTFDWTYNPSDFPNQAAGGSGSQLNFPAVPAGAKQVSWQIAYLFSGMETSGTDPTHPSTVGSFPIADGSQGSFFWNWVTDGHTNTASTGPEASQLFSFADSLTYATELNTGGVDGQIVVYNYGNGNPSWSPSGGLNGGSMTAEAQSVVTSSSPITQAWGTWMAGPVNPSPNDTEIPGKDEGADEINPDNAQPVGLSGDYPISVAMLLDSEYSMSTCGSTTTTTVAPGPPTLSCTDTSPPTTGGLECKLNVTPHSTSVRLSRSYPLPAYGPAIVP
jgi:hypothetical protein